MGWLSGIIKGIFSSIIDWWQGQKTINDMEQAKTEASTAKAKLESEYKTQDDVEKISDVMKKEAEDANKKIEDADKTTTDDPLGADSWNTSTPPKGNPKIKGDLK